MAAYRLLLSIMITGITTQSTMDTTEVIMLPHNPGLNFELYGQLKIVRSSWDIVIVLSSSKLEQLDKKNEFFALPATNDCQKETGWELCGTITGQDIIATKREELIRIEEEIAWTRANIGTPAPTNPRMKRNKLYSTPVLYEQGGVLAKSLFGLVTLKDLETIDNHLSKFSNSQTQAIKLQEKQMHLIKKDMSELKENFFKYGIEFVHQLNQTNERLTEIEKYDMKIQALVTYLALTQRDLLEYENMIKMRQNEL